MKVLSELAKVIGWMVLVYCAFSVPCWVAFWIWMRRDTSEGAGERSTKGEGK